MDQEVIWEANLYRESGAAKWGFALGLTLAAIGGGVYVGGVPAYGLSSPVSTPPTSPDAKPVRKGGGVPPEDPATEIAEVSQAASPAPSPEPEEGFEAPFPGKYGTSNGMWAFGKLTDRMRGITITEGYVFSREHPDEQLMIRLLRKSGSTYQAKLEFHKRTGFVICGDACQITISVDGKLMTLVARNADPGATELEIFDPVGFERLLKKSRILFIELKQDNGMRQYEFRTYGLDWAVAEDAEPMFTS